MIDFLKNLIRRRGRPEDVRMVDMRPLPLKRGDRPPAMPRPAPPKAP